MKTTKEILDFYGVEIGKRYKITDQSTEILGDWTGKTFVAVIDYRLLEIKFDHTWKRADISILNDFVYEEVKPEILTDKLV